LWQYKKHIGRVLMARVRESGGETMVSGRLKAVSETDVVLTLEGTGVERVVPFSSVTEARIKTPW
jgi:hypothetical protein